MEIQKTHHLVYQGSGVQKKKQGDAGWAPSQIVFAHQRVAHWTITERCDTRATTPGKRRQKPASPILSTVRRRQCRKLISVESAHPCGCLSPRSNSVRFLGLSRELLHFSTRAHQSEPCQLMPRLRSYSEGIRYPIKVSCALSAVPVRAVVLDAVQNVELVNRARCSA
jgi:hypothetical protein